MILLKGEIESVSTRKDRTVKVVIGTQELKPTEAGELFGLQNNLATVGIAPNEITPEEIELLQKSRLSLDDVPNGKSHSQRLRGALFVYWKQYDTGFKEFDSFYSDYMEKKINNVKSKLE